MLQRTLPAGFIAPCLPMKADKLPSGSGWLHEIKHDGGEYKPPQKKERSGLVCVADRLIDKGAITGE